MTAGKVLRGRIMFSDPRRLAVALAGLCAFLDLYATQSILPLFMQEFAASPAEVSLTVSAITFAVALIAPFVGIFADFIGRKRIIVGAMFLLVAPTVLLAGAGSLHQVVLLRFVQGLLLPPIFAITIVYIGDEWPSADVPSVTGIYMAGSALGGFLGRFISGMVSEFWGWRSAFLVLAAVTLVSACVVGLFLPRETRFVRASGLVSAVNAMIGNLRDPQLIAAFAVGFAVLFSFVAGFTYVNFYLAAPPFNLSPGGLGSIFIVYLFGVAVTPISGRVIQRFGRRTVVACAFTLWALSLLVTIIPSLPVVIAGLAMLAASGFVAQTCTTSYLAVAARRARASAVGLYVTFYYIGGSVGGVAPAPAWHLFGWPGVVGFIILVLGLALLLIFRYWHEAPLPAPPRS
ncbi:MAG: MFS transporter [Alphaproteobacteria bacterium]